MDRVGKEPTGRAFNSVAYLESENGRPRNPFINAGALVVTDEILARRPTSQALSEILGFVRAAANDNNIFVDQKVANSEMAHGKSNVALANFLAAYGNLINAPDDVTWLYFNQCAIEMSARQLARSGRFLSFPAALPRLASSDNAKGILALMMTCGHYDGSGSFAFHIGFPAKSGVGGGILAIVPGQASIAVWSPGLDVYGNSLVGTRALQVLARIMNWSVFKRHSQQAWYSGRNEKQPRRLSHEKALDDTGKRERA